MLSNGMSILQNLQFLRVFDLDMRGLEASKQKRCGLMCLASSFFSRLEIEKEIGKKKAVEKRPRNMNSENQNTATCYRNLQGVPTSSNQGSKTQLGQHR